MKRGGFSNNPYGWSIKDTLALSTFIITTLVFVYMECMTYRGFDPSDNQVKIFDSFLALDIICFTGYFFQEALPLASSIVGTMTNNRVKSIMDSVQAHRPPDAIITENGGIDNK